MRGQALSTPDVVNLCDSPLRQVLLSVHFTEEGTEGKRGVAQAVQLRGGRVRIPTQAA